MSRSRFIQSVTLVCSTRRTMAGIVKAVSAETGVTASQILSQGRGPSRISAARQEAYRRAMLANYSFPEIGRFFHRDHTTIMHGVRAATKRI